MRYQVANLGITTGGSTAPPPSESNPELAAKPYASSVDEICVLVRRLKSPLGYDRGAVLKRIMDIARNSGKYEDAVLESAEFYCPDPEVFRVVRNEIRIGRIDKRIRRKAVQEEVDTPTGGGGSQTPAGANTQPVQPQDVPTEGAGAPTPTGFAQPIPAYRSDLQQQIESYEGGLETFANRPSTPTLYDQLMTPDEVQAEAQRRNQAWLRSQERPDVASVQCPPGQFWDGRQCRGSVGSIPSIPGGFTASQAATTSFATPTSYGNYAGMGGRALGQIKQTDDVQFLKKQLKKCIQDLEQNPSQETANRCDEIQRLLTKAIQKIQKREGVQQQGFMPQVPLNQQMTQNMWSENYQGSMLPMAVDGMPTGGGTFTSRAGRGGWGGGGYGGLINFFGGGTIANTASFASPGGSFANLAGRPVRVRSV